jgi:hypothetical protein
MTCDFVEKRMRINAVKAGFVLGLFLGMWHAGWAVLVALGWAQPLLDFILWAHFVKVPVEIEPFAISRASILVGATAIVGFLTGWIIGLVWNMLHPGKT